MLARGVRCPEDEQDLALEDKEERFNLPLFKEIVSWIVELIVVIGLAYVLVSFFGIRTNVVGQAMEQTLGER